MCDITTLRNLLIGTLAAMVTVTGIIGAAIYLNGSIAGAPGSVVLMYIAAATTTVAWVLAGSAILALNAYCNCLMGRCEGLCSKLRSLLTGAVAVLVVQAYACLVAAGVSWLPWVGIGPMVVILTAMSIEVLLVGLGIVWLLGLVLCGQGPTNPAK